MSAPTDAPAPADAWGSLTHRPSQGAANQDGGRNPWYYLDNFQRVLDWIGERYADLLTEEEAGFLARFPTLPHTARALLVRMIMRKGVLFRSNKLDYEEVGCPLAAAKPLIDAGWLEDDPAVGLDTLFALCGKGELARMFDLPAETLALRKAAQLETLLAGHGDGAHPFSHWAARASTSAPVRGRLFGVVVRPLCDRLRLIFFGNFHQDWTELVLSDLGVFRYQPVDISPASRGFRSRSDVDHYIALHQAKQNFREGADPAAVLSRIPAAQTGNDWLGGRREKLLFQLAQQLEKTGDLDGAHAAYAGCRYPLARARNVRVLEKSGRYKQAHQLLGEALRSPESEAERQQLLRIAPRLTRQLGLPTARARKGLPPQRIDLRLPHPQTERWWVEGLVRDQLACDEAPVRYVENSLINTLFGLLCWEPIFAPLPGAFFHPYQRGPSDLGSADFVQRRAGLFAACLGELDSDAYLDTIERNHRRCYGISSPFVAWDFVDHNLLSLALACIAPQHLKRLFERMLLDLPANRSGFPDLIQFWPAERRYRMIEVKGPGDRLQDNQVRWLDYCALHQLPVAVCYLQWESPS
jgi:hypothetical protein